MRNCDQIFTDIDNLYERLNSPRKHILVSGNLICNCSIVLRKGKQA